MKNINFITVFTSCFILWVSQRNSVSENILLAYFTELPNKYDEIVYCATSAESNQFHTSVE